MICLFTLDGMRFPDSLRVDNGSKKELKETVYSCLIYIIVDVSCSYIAVRVEDIAIIK